MLLQMEEGKEEKGMQEAGVGRECFSDESLSSAGFPRSQQDASGCGTSL